MLYRKIQNRIKQHFTSGSDRILIVDGARQIGKSFIIRETCKELFKNYIEINLVEDNDGKQLFKNAVTVDDFYLSLSIVAGKKMGNKLDTVVFLDEIQAYPHLLTMLKFLKQDGKYTYIASGPLLGVTLSKTTSIPIGSIETLHMYPLDFEEFLIANGVGEFAINLMREKFNACESLSEAVHNKVMDLFRKYLFVGGLPDAVNAFVESQNIVKVRDIQKEIHEYYGLDAAKYDLDNKLKIKRIFDMVPSLLENKKKRVVMKDIENKKGKRFSNYADEFDYLINSGITLEVKAVSNPTFPLIESSGKNLLKLYMNDVGILTSVLYGLNIKAILDDVRSVNLGSVYECVVASELKAHGYNLYYYDNKSKGEVDYLIDDYNSLSVVPIEVKSGKDYTIHSALTHFMNNKDYNISKGYVLSNEREVTTKERITYLPIYYIMFFSNQK